MLPVNKDVKKNNNDNADIIHVFILFIYGCVNFSYKEIWKNITSAFYNLTL